MQKIWHWTQANAASGGVLAVFTGIIQFGVLSPIHQRFDAVDQRFDSIDQRLERLENGVSELRDLNERVSLNEERIQVIRQQLQTADAPSP